MKIYGNICLSKTLKDLAVISLGSVGSTSRSALLLGKNCCIAGLE